MNLLTNSTPSPKPNRLADHVADQLVAKSRQMSVGDKLPSESQLAAEFGVSRSVIREAISQLKSLGAVETRQGAGMFVTRPPIASLQFRDFDHSSLPSVAKFLEIRSGVDAAAARIAASRRTDAQLEFLRQASYRATQPGLSIEESVEADLAFHVAIVEATQNDYFLALQTFLTAYLRQGVLFTRRLESYSAAMVAEVHREHMAILQAIADQKPAEASHAAELHVLNAQRRMRHALSHLLPDIA